MKYVLKNIFCTLLLLFLLAGFTSAHISDSSVVGINGQLSVKGKYIVNQYDEPIVLRGMSLFWSQWGEGSKYYNENCIKWLSEDWNCTVVRAAMGVEMGGYLENPITEMNKVKIVIDACIKEGVYVIVDWHDHHAESNEAEAIEFFTEIANLYGNYPNVLYEIYNEPLQISWANVVKPYAERVITAIREIDSNNIILVGSPTWSQDVDVAANNPLNFKNIAYTLHYYAATHKDYLRTKAKNALAKGVALFVSEFGTCESSGDGVLDYNETSKWFDFLEENQIGWCNWSIADKLETAAALQPGANPSGGWSEENLTSSGKLIKEKIIAMNTLTNIDLEISDHNPKINSIKNYPNPFNSTTTINFSISHKSNVAVNVYNINGEIVVKLINAELGSGSYSYPIDFTNLPSGNYFLRFNVDDNTKLLKLQHLK